MTLKRSPQGWGYAIRSTNATTWRVFLLKNKKATSPIEVAGYVSDRELNTFLEEIDNTGSYVT